MTRKFLLIDRLEHLSSIVIFGATLIASFLTDDPIVWIAVFLGGYLIVFAAMGAIVLAVLVRDWMEARKQRQQIAWL